MKKILFIYLSLSLSCCFFSANANENILIKSSAVDREISISVSLPADYDYSLRTYPVVYLFDGPGYFELVRQYSEQLHQAHKIPELIIVSVPNSNRFQEFVGNDATNFSKMLTSELSKDVNEKYRTNGLNIGIGHSLGASFLLQQLSSSSNIFQFVSVSSPVISKRTNLNTDTLFNYIEHHCNSRGKIFLSKGNEAGVYQETIPILAKNAGAECLKYTEIKEQTHASLPLIAPFLALSYFFEGFMPLNIKGPGEINSIESLEAIGGYSAIASYYERISSNLPYKLFIPDIIVSRIAFTYLNAGKFEDIIQLFENEGKDRSRLIYYVSNRLIEVGQGKYAFVLLNLDRKLNIKTDFNQKLFDKLKQGGDLSYRGLVK
jgi:predicted alpha/beta superfamily hydrolase